MPTIMVSDHTLRLIREQTREGVSFISSATRRADGLWDVPVDEDVAAKIESERLPIETDDEVISRLIRTATGRLSN